MVNFEERVFVSQFDIQRNGCIGVRKTTEVLKDGKVISQTYWRIVLVPHTFGRINAPNKRQCCNAAKVI